jgi:hypothetical protein
MRDAVTYAVLSTGESGSLLAYILIKALLVVLDLVQPGTMLLVVSAHSARLASYK